MMHGVARVLRRTGGTDRRAGSREYMRSLYIDSAFGCGFRESRPVLLGYWYAYRARYGQNLEVVT